MKLDLGGGKNHSDNEFKNVDIESGADFVHDLSVFPWPWKDNSIEEIKSSHFFQEFKWEEVDKAWEECKRILVPGGKMTICVPDLDKQIKFYIDKEYDRFFAWGFSPGAKFIWHIQWKGKNISFFNHDLLFERLAEHGFEGIKEVEPENRKYESIAVECFKGEE